MTVALLVAILIAAAAVAYVVYPLLARRPRVPEPVMRVGSAAADPIEAAVRAYRAAHRECPRCGPRPEHDAIYCSECGLYLVDGNAIR